MHHSIFANEYSQINDLMNTKTYFIHDQYKSRQDPQYFNDIVYTDEWQDDVYDIAHNLAVNNNLFTVLDIGCGSGFKLRKYFGTFPYKIIGTDVEETVMSLREKYPNNDWRISDFNDRSIQSVDLVICSDVIEHIVNPDELLNFIKSIDFKYLVISTPDRNIINQYWGLPDELKNGPPYNIHHVREWAYEEFQQYLQSQFNVVFHIDSHFEHATQTAICVPKKRREKKEYSIIIPTYNHLNDLLRPCIESIITHTDLSNTEVIVVANGCTDGTGEYVRSLGDPFRVLEFDRALGFSRAVNLGIAESQGDYIILLNNDCILQDWQHKNQWIQMLRQPFIDDPLMGITGPTRHKNYEIDRYFMIFYCVMIDRKMFDEIGLLDEEFSPGAGEDVDFCIKIEDRGYHSFRVPDNSFEWSYQINFPIQHFGERTVWDQDDPFFKDWNQTIKRNQKLLESRYGFHHFRSIEGWLSEDEAQLLETLAKDKECIEVGSYKGKSSVCIAHVAKSLICIDSFSGSTNVAEGIPTDAEYVHATHEAFLENTKWYDNIRMIVKTSEEAAKEIPDESVDFIFIDGGHSYTDVTNDIRNYYSKLRVGGIIAFHDFYTDGNLNDVQRAIVDSLGNESEGLVETIIWYRKKSNGDVRNVPHGTVGILMPMYNAERYVEETIKSVQSQGYTNWKLFIVDNKSTDSSLSICKRIAEKDPRIIVIEHPFNSGIGGGRNVGLKEIEKDHSIQYIALLDADDLWYEYHLRDNLVLLENCFDGVIYSDCDFRHAITNEQLFPYGFPYHHSKMFNPDDLKDSNFIYVCWAIMKRLTFKKVGYFDETIEAYEDWDYWCRAALHHKIGFFHNKTSTGVYRINDKSQYKDLESAYIKVKNRYSLDLNLDSREDLVKVIDELELKIGCEIGVRAGNFSRFLLKNSKLSVLYSIDPWEEGYPEYFIDETKAVQALKPFGERSKIVKASSQDVVDQFEDEFFDFIYVDGGHDYESVHRDLTLYYPKLKRGGIISGHDYIDKYGDGVIKAVDEFTSLHNLPIYLTGITDKGYDDTNGEEACSKSWILRKPL